MTSFNLHITFGGMCLLVRDYREAQLCALLPQVPRGMGEPHTATLHLEVGGEIKHLSLPQKLDLSWVPGGQQISLDFPQRLVDLDYVTRRPIARELLDRPDPSMVASLVTLRAGVCGGASTGARWCLGPRPPRFMATTVLWIVRGINAEMLEQSFDAAEINAHQWLDQIRDASPTEVHLGIFNTPEDDKPSELPPERVPEDGLTEGTEVHHFAAFYELYRNPSPAEKPIPVFEDLGPRASSKIRALNEIRGIKYTCIGGAATARE